VFAMCSLDATVSKLLATSFYYFYLMAPYPKCNQVLHVQHAFQNTFQHDRRIWPQGYKMKLYVSNKECYISNKQCR